MKKSVLRKLLRSVFLFPLLPIIGATEAGNGGAGDGGDGGKGGTEPNPVTFTPEQTEEMNRIADSRAERARTSALKDYFKQQGMTEEEVSEALNAYKAEQAKKKTPQQIADEANIAIENANKRLILAECKVQAAALGISASNISGVIKLAEGLDAIKVNDNGEVDSESIKKALEDVIKNYPGMRGTTQQSLGGGSNPQEPGGDKPGSFGASLAKSTNDKNKNNQDALNKLYGI